MLLFYFAPRCDFFLFLCSARRRYSGVGASDLVFQPNDQRRSRSPSPFFSSGRSSFNSSWNSGALSKLCPGGFILYSQAKQGGHNKTISGTDGCRESYGDVFGLSSWQNSCGSLQIYAYLGKVDPPGNSSSWLRAPSFAKIVANSQFVNRPLLTPQGRELLLRRLKRRRKSTAELLMGNRSMELLVNEPKDLSEAGPSSPIWAMCIWFSLSVLVCYQVFLFSF